jgi:hypothetical protein
VRRRAISFGRHKGYLGCFSAGFEETSRAGSFQREPERAPVCPQNRAYGSIHGSSCHIYPLTNIKPMRLLFI